MYTPSYLARGVCPSLFLAKVRSPTGSMRPSLLYVIAVEGMGTGPRRHRVPTSVFPPRCAITHRRDTRRGELPPSLSISFSLSSLRESLPSHPHLPSILFPIALSPPALPPNTSFTLSPFPRAFVYYMLNYDDLRLHTQNTTPLAARPGAHAGKRAHEADSKSRARLARKVANLSRCYNASHNLPRVLLSQHAHEIALAATRTTRERRGKFSMLSGREANDIADNQR